MAIINNRKKIASEVPSQKYKDNYDAIFGKKDNTIQRAVKEDKEKKDK